MALGGRFCLGSARRPRRPRTRPKPVFPAVPRALQWVGPFRGCLHGWCRPWSSKPVGGVNNAPSGFDSHTLPLAPANPRREAALVAREARRSGLSRLSGGLLAFRRVARRLRRQSGLVSLGPSQVHGQAYPEAYPDISATHQPSAAEWASLPSLPGACGERRCRPRCRRRRRTSPHGQPSRTPGCPTAAAARFQAACWAGVMRRASADSITRVHSATSGMSSQEARVIS